MLIRRQRVLLISSIEQRLRISGTFSDLFIMSNCDGWWLEQIIEKRYIKLLS